MAKIDPNKVSFKIECLPEHIPIKGNVYASGDEQLDKESENWVRNQLEKGNEWAWCCIKVTAQLGPLEGIDYLGACSYKSEKDFMECGYYEDMKNRALEDLQEQVDLLLPLIGEE